MLWAWRREVEITIYIAYSEFYCPDHAYLNYIDWNYQWQQYGSLPKYTRSINLNITQPSLVLWGDGGERLLNSKKCWCLLVRKNKKLWETDIGWHIRCRRLLSLLSVLSPPGPATIKHNWQSQVLHSSVKISSHDIPNLLYHCLNQTFKVSYREEPIEDTVWWSRLFLILFLIYFLIEYQYNTTVWVWCLVQQHACQAGIENIINDILWQVS